MTSFSHENRASQSIALSSTSSAFLVITTVALGAGIDSSGLLVSPGVGFSVLQMSRRTSGVMASDDKSSSSSSTEWSAEPPVSSPTSPSHLTHFKPLTPEQDDPPLRSAYSSFVNLFRFNNKEDGRPPSAVSEKTDASSSSPQSERSWSSSPTQSLYSSRSHRKPHADLLRRTSTASGHDDIVFLIPVVELRSDQVKVYLDHFTFTEGTRSQREERLFFRLNNTTRSDGSGPLHLLTKERTGQDRTGQDRTGQERKEQEREGAEREGKERTNCSRKSDTTLSNHDPRTAVQLRTALKRLKEIMEGKSQDSDLKQYWMPDSQCKECYDCNEKFTTFRRRHHCRLCGQIFCSRCCNQEIPGKFMGYTGDLRSCTYCHKIALSYAHSADPCSIGEDLSALSDSTCSVCVEPSEPRTPVGGRKSSRNIFLEEDLTWQR
ncbi:1-phosphatidylinositol 3-phosphate 5-kinase [Liparis tanakae]|uniref:1-phosphatidylinositol 3-phosphate 5-kinase n=1 Tax=Liparis tanakae TaxID=230148 RepID=A0A4Z2F7V2_9TELE|nr:1-phosphatidylinositol 3-phosphate 5-kinase [Liparis tanakae]